MQEMSTLLQESRTSVTQKRDLRTAISRLAAVAFLGMVAIAVLVLAMRSILGLGWIWLQETVLWLHAGLFLIGGFLATVKNEHVRIEILREKMLPNTRLWLERLGHIFLMLPMMMVLFWSSLAPVARSWLQLEASPAAGGLPALFLLKTLLPLTALALLVWGVRASLSKARPS